jgi:copper chaperone
MMTQLTMQIGGMSCGHCVAAVTKALKALQGVAVEQVAIGSATVNYDPSATSAEAIAKAVEEEGYPVRAAA